MILWALKLYIIVVSPSPGTFHQVEKTERRQTFFTRLALTRFLLFFIYSFMVHRKAGTISYYTRYIDDFMGFKIVYHSCFAISRNIPPSGKNRASADVFHAPGSYSFFIIFYLFIYGT